MFMLVCVRVAVWLFREFKTKRFRGGKRMPLLLIIVHGLACFQSRDVMCHRAAVRECGQNQKEISQVGTHSSMQDAYFLILSCTSNASF